MSKKIIIKTKEQIDRAYLSVQKMALAKMSVTKATNTDVENVRLLMESNPSKIWWFAHEFMGFHNIKGNKFFIGYECSARLSELSNNTQLTETRRASRYKVRRYRFENINNSKN